MDIVERLRPTEDEVNQRCDEWDGWGFYDAVEEVLERENQVAKRETTIQSLRDQNADLERQLATRDSWLVANDHWTDFTRSLSEPVERGE